MFVKESDNFNNRARQALTLPIPTRCAQLTVLFDRGTTTELLNFFPTLLDHIFGPQGTSSWGLRSPKQPSDEDYRQMLHFLSPMGPVFKLIYTLLKDPAAKFEFSATYLPIKVKQILEHRPGHPFYSDLIHLHPQTRQVHCLLLNAFDYYMFHFAYHLINPWQQRCTEMLQQSTTLPSDSALVENKNKSSWGTVYFDLSCDYIAHFLPLDPSSTVLPVIQYKGKSPAQPMQMTTPRSSASKLINTNLLGKSVEDFSVHQNIGRDPRNEIWRSETVLSVFIDIWIDNDQISPQQSDQTMNNSFFTSSLLQFKQLPTSEYMRIVRVFVKQIHAFSASVKIDDTYMSELKRIAVPMLQGKLYIFLRNLIHRWPLDGSFRLVLELWLTYIQPWRYAASLNKKNVKQDLDNDTIVTVIDREYLPFIAENLLTYEVIFQQLLPRFGRVDLVSPKMSVMLYRITKVFNQRHLKQFLQEIESCVNHTNQTQHPYSNHVTNLPPLNGTTTWCSNTPNSANNESHFQSFSGSGTPLGQSQTALGNKKWCAVVNQKIFDLEGPTFHFKPLFAKPNASEVFELMSHVKKSIRVAQEIAQSRQKLELEQSTFMGMWKSFLGDATSDDFSLIERVKVPAYLEFSLQNLMELFDLNEVPEDDNMNFSTASTTSSTSGRCLEMSNDFRFLTPQKVYERLNQIKYQGDPDLHPIRSSEVGFLVRMFYQMSQYINEKYQTRFCQLYYNQGLKGRVARQFLLAPMTVYQYDKSVSHSPRTSRDLPPRISLRGLASYSFLAWFTIWGLIFYLFGYGPTMYTCVVIIGYVFYKCVTSVFSSASPVRHNYPTEGFGNISFDDSF